MKIAVIGGTGPQGRGLAMRWAQAGHEVVVGSRKPGRAADIAADLNERVGAVDHAIVGLGNADAVAAVPEMVVVTVPYSAHVPTLESIRDQLAGKILVDVTVPLAADNPKKMDMPPEGSATEQAQALLGPDIPVVAAFQNLSAGALEAIDHPLHCDVLICGNSKAAKDKVIPLATALGCKAWNVGLAESARCVESLTSLLIRLNIAKSYPDLKHAGISISGGVVHY